MTREQAVAFISTFYRMEVESWGNEFVMTESLRRCIGKVAGFLTGESRKRGLMLLGMIGNGKTTMVKVIAKLFSYLMAEDYIENEKCFETVSAKELSMLISEDRGRYDEYKECDKLIIDDLGTDAKIVTLYKIDYEPVKDILMYRYSKRLLTVITSNLDPTMIKEHYGDERLTDRFREMYEIVEFEDESFRK